MKQLLPNPPEPWMSRLGPDQLDIVRCAERAEGHRSYAHTKDPAKSTAAAATKLISGAKKSYQDEVARQLAVDEDPVDEQPAGESSGEQEAE